MTKGSKASSRAPHIGLLGVGPPPVGGVTMSTTYQAKALEAAGADVTFADFRRGLAIVRLLAKRPAVIVLNASGPRTAWMSAMVLAVRSRPSILLVHATDLGDRLCSASMANRVLVRLLGRAERIWVNHSMVRLPPFLKLRAEVIALPSAPRIGPSIDFDQFRILTSAYELSSIYNIDLCVEVVRRLRGKDTRWKLEIASYGPGREVPESEYIGLDGVTLHSDLSHDALLALLSSAGVLLRATSTDGDSVVVREALALGVPVVASDAAPRPIGVRTSPLDVDSLCVAVESSITMDRSPYVDDSFEKAVISLGSRFR